MSKKEKKGKKDKKVKEETDKLSAVDRTFYELTITDLNNKLSRLRSHVAKLEETNEDLAEKMQQMEEDRTDVTAHLDRSLAEKTDNIKELDEQLIELAKVRERENKESADKIKELECKYKAMHEQLTSEIKLLNGKLNSLEEFRVQRDDLLAKFDEQEAQTKEQERRHKEAINDIEQNAIVEKDHLKKEVETKLLQLSEDFTKSSEIRIAGYTRRLIRENIALTKEMDSMMVTQQRMETQHKELLRQSKDMNEKFTTNEITKQRLVRTAQNQIEIIENLTNQYENLKAKYIQLNVFKSLYENSLKKDVVERFTHADMAKKVRIMSQRVEMLKSDKLKLISLHQKHENEIIRLRGILRKIKFSVSSAIRGNEEKCYTDKRFRKDQRENLLSELLKIIISYEEDLEITPSARTISSTQTVYYKPGAAGFVPKSKASLLELFKREAKKIASAELISPEFKQKQSDMKITPQQRPTEDTLFDVECGSSIVFSSSSENLANIVQEEMPDDEVDDFGVTSSSESAIKLEEKKSDVPPAKSSSKLSALEKFKKLSSRSAATVASVLGGEVEVEVAVEEESEDDDEVQFFY